MALATIRKILKLHKHVQAVLLTPAVLVSMIMGLSCLDCPITTGMCPAQRPDAVLDPLLAPRCHMCMIPDLSWSAEMAVPQPPPSLPASTPSAQKHGGLPSLCSSTVATSSPESVQRLCLPLSTTTRQSPLADGPALLGEIAFWPTVAA